MASESASLTKEKEELINEILAYDGHGKRVYLLGSAEYGPVNEPIRVKSTVGLHNKFGKRGTLIKAFHAFSYVNKDAELYLVKVLGQHSTAYLNVNIFENEIIKDGVTLVASQANEIFDKIQIELSYDNIMFHFPEELNKPSITYSFKDYPTIGQLCEKMNEDVRNKISYVQCYYSVDPSTRTKHAFHSVNPTIMYMYGGECCLNYSKNLLYNCLGQAYEILESMDIDFIIPVDAFMDDVYPDDSEENQYQYDLKFYHSNKDYLTEDPFGNHPSFMNQLINFCLRQLNFGVITTGIMGYNSQANIWSNYIGESDDLKYLYKACLEYNLSLCNNPDYSFLVNVVAGDILYNYGTITDCGYLAYAALCSKMNMTVSATNKPVDNIAIYEEFEEETLFELADAGIVCFRHSPLYEKPVVYDAVTPSQFESFHMQCNVRQCQMAISYLNKLYQFFIGWDMIKIIKDGTFLRNTDQILKAVRNAGIISEYEFEIVPFYSEGHIKVYLTLKTLYMTKAVHMVETINVAYLGDDE